jgi:hypothetical protein
MKNLIVFISIAVLFTNCKKEKVTYTIKGQITICYSPTNQVSYANSKIDLFQQKNGTFSGAQTLANTTTDANGNFAFDYTTDNQNDNLIIRESSGFGYSNIMTGIPLKNIDDLKIYYNGRYNLVVSLNVTKLYTNSDTLSIRNLNGGINPKIAGPFVNGRIYKEVGIGFLRDIVYTGTEQTLNYRIYTSQNLDFTKDFIVENSKLCGDTVYVSLDIK